MRKHLIHCGKNLDTLWENNGCIVGKQWIHCEKTLVGEDTVIRNSVIGNGCTIGAHCEIDGAYIWDDTVVEAGCRIQKSVIASRCFIGEGSVILAGSILSFAVRIGPNARVPVGTRLVGQADQVALLDGFAEVSFFCLNFADSHREKCHGAFGLFWCMIGLPICNFSFDRLIDWSIFRLIDWSIFRLIDWLIFWLIDWFVTCQCISSYYWKVFAPLAEIIIRNSNLPKKMALGEW